MKENIYPSTTFLYKTALCSSGHSFIHLGHCLSPHWAVISQTSFQTHFPQKPKRQMGSDLGHWREWAFTSCDSALMVLSVKRPPQVMVANYSQAFTSVKIMQITFCKKSQKNHHVCTVSVKVLLQLENSEQSSWRQHYRDGEQHPPPEQRPLHLWHTSSMKMCCKLQFQNWHMPPFVTLHCFAGYLTAVSSCLCASKWGGKYLWPLRTAISHKLHTNTDIGTQAATPNWGWHLHRQQHRKAQE